MPVQRLREVNVDTDPETRLGVSIAPSLAGAIAAPASKLRVSHTATSGAQGPSRTPSAESARRCGTARRPTYIAISRPEPVLAVPQIFPPTVPLQYAHRCGE